MEDDALELEALGGWLCERRCQEGAGGRAGRVAKRECEATRVFRLREWEVEAVWRMGSPWTVGAERGWEVTSVRGSVGGGPGVSPASGGCR